MSPSAQRILDHGGAEPLQREKLGRTLQKLAQMAPESLSAHATLFHRTEKGEPIVPRPHHEEWIRFLQARDKFRWLVVIAPPGYAKSTWFSQAYISWRIGVSKGRARVGLISNSGSLAEDLGKSVADAIENPRYQHVYGIGPDMKKGWSLGEMWTTGAVDKSNPNLHCVGIGGTVQGRRYDEIVLDDPSTWEQVRSETTMKGQRFFLKSTLLERFPPGLKPPDGEGRMVVVMTRWGERDLVETFRELGFKIITMPALGYWDRVAICPSCGQKRDTDWFSLLRRCEHCKSEAPPEMEWGEEPLWGERESRQVLLNQREEDPITFDLVKQGDPKALGGDMFDTGMLNYKPMPDRREFEQVVQYVDTAGGKDRAKGDYFCLVTLGLRKQGQEVWVLDVERGRWPAPEQERKVIDEFRQWTPNAVVVEDKGEGNALYQSLIISPEVRIPLRTHSPIADKEWRARPWANVLNAGRVYIPTNQDGTPVRWARPFVTEHDAFPESAHDDQVDAAANAYAHTTTGAPRIRVLRRGM